MKKLLAGLLLALCLPVHAEFLTYSPGYPAQANNTVVANTSGGAASPTAVPFDFNIFDILGADKTGLADSTAALGAAAVLFPDLAFPGGTYSVCDLQITAGDVPRHFHGPAILKTAAACDLEAIRFNCANGTARLEFNELTIDGNSTNQTHGAAIPAHGLYVVSCPNINAHNFTAHDSAGHNVFYSNPASPASTYSQQEISDVQLYNSGAGNDTYGSGLVITNGLKTKVTNVNCNTAAKGCFRFSGDGLQFTNVTGRNYGNSGMIPVAGATTNWTVNGGDFRDGTIFSDAARTGSTNTNTTVNAISGGNVITAGWQVGYNISDASGDIPANATIVAIASGGLSVTISAAATGSHTGNVLTVTNTSEQDTNDGIRCVGAPGMHLSNVTSMGNPGAGVSLVNGCNNSSIIGGTLADNGKAAAVAGTTAGRSGIVDINTSSPNLGLSLASVNIYDDQGTPTQDYALEVKGSSDYVSTSSLVVGTNQTGCFNFTTSGVHVNTLGTTGPGACTDTAIPATGGGTGFSSYAVGDLLSANTTTTLSRVADVATGSILASGGVSTLPAWTALGSGVLTFLQTPTSANLAAAVSDETGTGAAVFAGSPALTGVPTSPAFNLTGAISKSNIGATGARLFTTGGTVTDPASSGTVAVVGMNTLDIENWTPTNATTATRLATLVIPGAPAVAGAGTATNSRSLLVQANVAEFLGGLTSSGGTFNANANAAAAASNVGTGTTTGLVTLGGGSDGVVINSNQAGSIKDTGLISTGTKFTTTGCSVSSTTGGATAGIFTLGANSCTVVVTMNGATGLTAPNGWTCQAHDRTGISVIIDGESSSTTTTASIVIPVTAGATDVIAFSCTGY